MNASQMIQAVVCGQSVDDVLSFAEGRVIPIPKSVRKGINTFADKVVKQVSKAIKKAEANKLQTAYKNFPDDKITLYALGTMSDVFRDTTTRDYGPAFSIHMAFLDGYSLFHTAALVINTRPTVRSIESILVSANYDTLYRNIKLLFNGSATLAEVKAEIKNRGLRKVVVSSLLHEVTHGLDYGMSSHNPEYSDNAAYFNDPYEIRAVAQSIVNDIQIGLRRFKGLTPGSQKFNTAVRKLLDRSYEWKRLVKDLTPDNKQVILKAVYAGAQDEVERA